MPVDFFEALFLLKNSHYRSFRVDFGVRFLLLCVINAVGFWLCWAKLSLLVKLGLALLTYNVSASFFSYFDLHSVYADSLFTILNEVSPIETFWWYIALAIFFFNFSRFDSMLLVRYRRVTLTVNVIDILTIAAAVALYVLVYDYVIELTAAWFSHIAQHSERYAMVINTTGLLPAVSGEYTLGLFQVYLICGGYLLACCATLLLVYLPAVYYRARSFIATWRRILLGRLKPRPYLAYAVNATMVYLTFKLLKIAAMFVFFCQLVYGVIQTFVFSDSLGAIFFVSSPYNFYIFLFILINFSLIFGARSSRFLLF